MNKRLLIVGTLLLALFALIAGGSYVKNNRPKPVEFNAVNVYGGLIFQKPEVIQYLHDKYQIDVQETMMGSFAQAEADLTGVDCVHPGSATAADYFNEKNPGKAKRSDTLFSTYLMVYTWKSNLTTLMSSGVVYEKDGSYFMKMKQVADAMGSDKNWSDLNVDIPGFVFIDSTDPLKSSSGMVFLQLLADYQIAGGENGGKVTTPDTINAVLPFVNHYWQIAGNQEKDSPSLFQKFIRSGEGLPMIVNYESAYPEWYNGLSADLKKQADGIVGIYPEVTINTDHILISITPKCEKLAGIMVSDPWITQFAWSALGMRNGQGGINAKPGDTVIPWIAKSVPAMHESKKAVVDLIKSVLK